MRKHLYGPLAGLGMALGVCGLAYAQPAPPSKEALMVQEALEKVCLPAVASGAPVADLAASAGYNEQVLKSGMMRSLMLLADGDRLYPHRSGKVVVTEHPNGGCTVRAWKGAGAELMTAAEQAILDRPEAYAAGRIGLSRDRSLVRRTWCAEHGGSHFAVAGSYAVKRGAVPIQVTVMEAAESDPWHCQPGGSVAQDYDLGRP